MNTVSTTVVAQTLGLSPRAVQLRAKRENWPCQKAGRSLLFDTDLLPPDIRTKLVSPEVPKQFSQVMYSETFAGAREEDRRVATARAGLIGEYYRSGLGMKDFLEAYNLGLYRAQFEVLGEVGEKTFYRWLKIQRDQGSEGLIPKWSLKKEVRRDSLSQAEKDLLKTFYLTEKKWSVAQCYDRMREVFKDGRASLSTARRYLTQDLDKASVAYWREGKIKFRDKHLDYIDRDPTKSAPMKQVQSDHHMFDFFIKHEGKLVRPWITVMLDYFSGKVLSWVPSLNPCAATIGTAYAKMVIEFGAPLAMHTDNGKDYLAKSLTGGEFSQSESEEEGEKIVVRGIYQLCGSQLIKATPYNGKSKGRVERLFGALKERFAKEWPTYCGSNTTARTEETQLLFRSMNNMPQIETNVTWEDYVRVVNEFFPLWNAKWRGKGKGKNGRTADEVFTSKPSLAKPVDMAILEANFGTPLVRTVNRCRIEVDNLSFGSLELGSHSGEKVLARRLWHDPKTVVVQDIEGRFICRAECGYMSETDDLRKVMELKGIQSKYLTQKARDLKPKGIDGRWDLLPLAAGAEHLSQTLVEETPKITLKGILDAPSEE